MIRHRQFLSLCSLGLLAACTGTTPSTPSRGANQPFRLGVDVLAKNGFDLLRGRRVGLICNHTSMSATGITTRQVMLKGGVNLVALYAPEHGIDGTIKAGIHVPTRTDPVTGLVVHSLYGPTRKPTPSQLSGIDVLVFDLQDIGSRSYTYISTMLVAMEACGEQGKLFVVLDRPNPLGGYRVEGPHVEPAFKSFVSQANIPYVHGLTTGELAMMACGEGWLTRKPSLRVVKMTGWRRNMMWRDTGARWYRTSPNIPHMTSPAYYVTTGILGGSAGVDVGIGTENPFGYAGTTGISAEAFTAYCRRLNLPGISFTPYSRSSFSGVKLQIDLHSPANLTALGVNMLAELNRLKGGALLQRMNANQISLFNKVYGSDSLRRDLMRGGSAESAIRTWRSFENNFKSRRQKYLMY